MRLGGLVLLLLLGAPQASAESPVAAPGYIDDAVCGQCHREIYENYKTVGMSRAFYPPSKDVILEDFENGHYFHEPSQRHYEMRETDGRFFFKRYRKGADGKERDVLEREVHWILGSGSNARTYIHQTEWGELFQLPISWYTRSQKWAMAPGYDNAEHQGVTRRVQRDCMFCHNAYPEVAPGSDVHGEPQIFPKELPSGLGCQRCHGPGAAHVRLSFDLDAGEEELRAAIVNPAHLEPERREEVCLQCHLQPTVSLSGVRHFDRTMYSYRPGQPLDDYIVQMDVVEERAKEDRFEINHHPYRLHQSRCFLESEGQLSCLTCHDPHHKPRGEAAKIQYRDACLSCHRLSECQLEAMADAPGVPQGVAPDDCATCHMPRRRTQDVIEATMTDHLIRRRPGGPELLDTMPEQEHRIRTVQFLRSDRAPQGPVAEVYRQLAMVRAGSRAALDRLRSALAEARPEAVSPYLELAVGELEAGRFAAAEATLGTVLQKDSENVTARLHLAVALAAQGKGEAALESFRKVLAKDPERPEVQFNYGKFLVQAGQVEAALPHFQVALKARPHLDQGWLELGNALARLGRYPAAAASYRQALVVEPRNPSAQQNLVEALLRAERREEALRELRDWLHFEPGNQGAQSWLRQLTQDGGSATGASP